MGVISLNEQEMGVVRYYRGLTSKKMSRKFRYVVLIEY